MKQEIVMKEYCLLISLQIEDSSDTPECFSSQFLFHWGAKCSFLLFF